MSQPTTAPSASTLYPQLESPIAPLENSEVSLNILKTEKHLIKRWNYIASHEDILNGMEDTSILPSELIAKTSKTIKAKIDPLKRLNEISNEEAEDEEEPEDEEDEDEEVHEDEEDDAGGDYLVSHFDNGEGFEDNDEDGDDMAGVI